MAVTPVCRREEAPARGEAPGSAGASGHPERDRAAPETLRRRERGVRCASRSEESRSPQGSCLDGSAGRDDSALAIFARNPDPGFLHWVASAGRHRRRHRARLRSRRRRRSRWPARPCGVASRRRQGRCLRAQCDERIARFRHELRGHQPRSRGRRRREPGRKARVRRGGRRRLGERLLAQRRERRALPRAGSRAPTSRTRRSAARPRSRSRPTTVSSTSRADPTRRSPSSRASRRPARSHPSKCSTDRSRAGRVLHGSDRDRDEPRWQRSVSRDGRRLHAFRCEATTGRLGRRQGTSVIGAARVLAVASPPTICVASPADDRVTVFASEAGAIAAGLETVSALALLRAATRLRDHGRRARAVVRGAGRR